MYFTYARRPDLSLKFLRFDRKNRAKMRMLIIKFAHKIMADIM
jgi:hypothetical protein